MSHNEKSCDHCHPDKKTFPSAHELAEKILRLVTNQTDPLFASALTSAESLLSSALDKEYWKGWGDSQSDPEVVADLTEIAKAEAYENAAKIVTEKSDLSCGFPEFGRELAEAIRQRARELK